MYVQLVGQEGREPISSHLRAKRHRKGAKTSYFGIEAPGFKPMGMARGHASIGSFLEETKVRNPENDLRGVDLYTVM